ncbi:hypothetical protein [Sphingomonas sp. HMP6]|uniref:hypothetical protein n=1 Tax=Sphingomonas sp. HMP6 TaxID=1517551 RepID=UPI0015965E7D|nr:hypothetical protein [Sphingomonas sp. HMP6]BCA60238.1 hypothetical protein HMP06_3007 [Sphingomonas sp. HMP6]
MISWSPSTKHFYHAEIHGSTVPADSVRVTARRHTELLEGQRQGRAILATTTGKPTLSPILKPTVDQLRAFAIADIKAEAARRILAVASIARQTNDNAAIAAFALGLATGTKTADGAQKQEASAALRRRAAIDALRAASNTLEHKIATWSALALSSFDASDDGHWPVEG